MPILDHGTTKDTKKHEEFLDSRLPCFGVIPPRRVCDVHFVVLESVLV